LITAFSGIDGIAQLDILPRGYRATLQEFQKDIVPPWKRPDTEKRGHVTGV
jgi:hypothetical protein